MTIRSPGCWAHGTTACASGADGASGPGGSVGLEPHMDIFDYPFMRSAFVMGIVLGVLFPLMGIFVVTRGMAFFSDFIAHAAILGIALSAIAGAEPTVFLIIYSVFVAFVVSSVWNRFPLSRDTVLGAFYGGTVALGIILIYSRGLSQRMLFQSLFGDILLISSLDIALSVVLLVAFLAFLATSLRKLIKSSLLPEMSRAEGVNVQRYERLLTAFMAMAIAISIKVVGVILANAMIVLPAAAAKTLSRNFREFMLIAPIAGVLSFAVGIALSYYFDFPSGPAVVVSAFGIFLISLPIGAARR